MELKIKEFATLISSPKLCKSLRYGHYLIKEDGGVCHIFNIDFALAKRLAANYGQQPFAFHKVDKNGIIKQYYDKLNPSQPIRKTNDYVLREESRIDNENIEFDIPPFSTLLSLNGLLVDVSDEALTYAREAVGQAAIRIRKEVYKDAVYKIDTLKSLEYYRYKCEETFYFSWRIPAEDTRLPVDIFIDQGFAYLQYNHPLWLYFCNGYTKGAELEPLIIGREPYRPYDTPLQIASEEFDKLTDFAQRFRHELLQVANREIEPDDFIENIVRKERVL